MIYTKKNIHILSNISSLYTPVIVIGLNNKRYVVINGINKGWYEISDDINMEDIKNVWKISTLNNKKEWTVLSSKKDKSYKITYNNNQWTCTCSSFIFRKTCKHITDLISSFDE